MHGQAAQSAGSPALLQMMGGLHHKTIPGQVPSQNYTWTGSLSVAKMPYCLHFPMRALPTCCTVCTFSRKALPKCCTVCTFSRKALPTCFTVCTFPIQHRQNAVLSAAVHTALPKRGTVCSCPYSMAKMLYCLLFPNTALPKCCTVCRCPCSIATMLYCLQLSMQHCQNAVLSALEEKQSAGDQGQSAFIVFALNSNGNQQDTGWRRPGPECIELRPSRC